MTSLASRIAPRESAVRDLVAVWLTVTAVLTYLDVPLQHSPLFATNLVLQSSLGAVVITGLLRGLAPSLLLLCGPSLVLGGGMSFAVYQAFGRGMLGAGVSAGLGVMALVHMLRRASASVTESSRWWQLGQVTGMALLVLSSEFGELLPVAALLFLLGFVNFSPRISGLFVTRMANLTGLGVAIVMWLLRQDYWWLVTDDYLFLQVVMRHITSEGPFASWGVNNFARYHWLSYGWAGVLDTMSGSPSPLVTLTRVMPFTYAVSMAASVMLILKQRMQLLTPTSVMFAWAVVAVGRFGWSGTSTGGVYALLAAAMLLGMISLGNRAHWSRKALLGLLLVGAIALTKFPSVFTVLLVAITALSVLGTSSIADQLFGRFVRWLGLTIAIPLLFVALWITSRLLDERFAVALINPGLGQLSTLGIPFAGFTLIVNQLWLWVAALLLTFEARKTLSRNDGVSSLLVQTCVLALFAGLLCELLISTNADAYAYFSGPLYFVASLSFLFLDPSNRSGSSLGSRVSGQLVMAAPFLGAGLLWGLTELQRATWLMFLRLVSISPNARIDVLMYFTTDPRIGVALLVGILTLTGFVQRRRTMWTGYWVAVSVLFAFVNLIPQSISEFRRGLPASEVDVYLGSRDERAVGRWIRDNTDPSSVIATNHGFGSIPISLADFALAAWSDRRFLVLGPNLDPTVTEQRVKAVELSEGFAAEPTREHCSDLREFRVGWFVVDTSLTDTHDWSRCTRKTYASGDFIVLEIDSDFAP